MNAVYQWLLSVGNGRPTRSKEDVLVTNYMFLRKAVGLLGTLLPFILLAFNPIAVKIVDSGWGVTPSGACQTVAAVSTREQVVGDIHFVSAGLMFIFLAWMAIRFTNTDSPQPPPQKLLRNLIYKICAIVILACLVAAVITNFLPASVRVHFSWWLFLYEALAILAFGVSWFVKGQTLIGPLKDKNVPPPVTEPAVQH